MVAKPPLPVAYRPDKLKGTMPRRADDIRGGPCIRRHPALPINTASTTVFIVS